MFCACALSESAHAAHTKKVETSRNVEPALNGIELLNYVRILDNLRLEEVEGNWVEN